MRLIDGDYLYNKLVANKCPYDLVLQMVKDEPTVDVLEQIRAEIEELQGDTVEVADFQGNRYTYESIYKADVLAIIYKHIN